jgi:hypothetical protein
MRSRPCEPPSSASARSVGRPPIWALANPPCRDACEKGEAPSAIEWIAQRARPSSAEVRFDLARPELIFPRRATLTLTCTSHWESARNFPVARHLHSEVRHERKNSHGCARRRRRLCGPDCCVGRKRRGLQRGPARRDNQMIKSTPRQITSRKD